MARRFVALPIGIALVLGAGCGSESARPPSDDQPDAGAGDADAPAKPEPDIDDSEALFDHMIEVQIEMAVDDWNALRHQTRDVIAMLDGEDCLSEPFGSPFTYFPATVTIDGEALEDVGVRKKGLLGSLSETKPSLKLDFGEYVPDRELLGLNKLTLQNSLSDPSFVRQCLAYALFADAGIPAPRCHFAHVEVNGRDLGVYVNLESVGKDFLRRHFADEDGNLYEGTLSDFRPGWIGSFEKKTNEEDPDRSDLEDVAQALDADDAVLADSLEPFIDVDAFLTYWAMEILTAHIDGYASNTNNFFIYHDPATDQFFFFPWGVDATFSPGNPFGGPYASVYATGLLARRLYELTETRDRYLVRLRELLDTVWREDEILARIDAMEDVIAPVADPWGEGGLAVAVQEIRAFVRGRRGEILAEIDGGRPPTWDQPLRDPPCLIIAGTAVGTFETTFGTLGSDDVFDNGSTGTLEVEIDGAPLSETAVTSVAGYDPQNPGVPVIGVVAALDDGTVAIAYLPIDPAQFASGARIPLGVGVAWPALIRLDPSTNQMTPIGLILNGSVVLEEASTGAGATVRGSFTGDVVRFPWL